MDFEDAMEQYGAPIQCGTCYEWYDASEAMNGTCPYCGSDEMVGDK